MRHYGRRELRNGGMLIWLGRCQRTRRSSVRLTGRRRHADRPGLAWPRRAAPAREARDDLDRAWRVTAQWRRMSDGFPPDPRRTTFEDSIILRAQLIILLRLQEYQEQLNRRNKNRAIRLISKIKLRFVSEVDFIIKWQVAFILYLCYRTPYMFKIYNFIKYIHALDYRLMLIIIYNYITLCNYIKVTQFNFVDIHTFSFHFLILYFHNSKILRIIIGFFLSFS